MEILTANALLVGESTENMKKIMASNTTEEATKYIEKTEVYSLLAEKAKQKCEEYCQEKRLGIWKLRLLSFLLKRKFLAIAGIFLIILKESRNNKK